MRSTLAKVIISVLFCFITLTSFAQKDFDSQIKRVSDSLVSKILKTGKKRVAVSNFVDLQGNITELGKYISEAISIELTNTPLEVVDRSQLNELMRELKLTEEKLVRPENALKLGEMAGVEFIIIGTTTMLDNVVDITVKSLDIQKGTAIGGQRVSVPKTDAINNLMRSSVNNNSAQTTAANVDAGRKVDAHDRGALDDLFQTSISELRKGECTTTFHKGIVSMGQICFENQTGQDLVFYCEESAFGSWLTSNKIGLPSGGRNCSTLIPTDDKIKGQTMRQARFTFTTADKSRSARLNFTIEQCRVKSIVLTKKNLMLVSR